MPRRPFIPPPYYMTPAAERAMQFLTEHSPETALRLSLGHAGDCWTCEDYAQWRYWLDVVTMVRIFAVVRFEYQPRRCEMHAAHNQSVDRDQ